MAGAPWSIDVDAGDRDVVVATAIHAGHEIRPEVASLSKLTDAERLREEDPFTDRWLDIAGTRLVAHRSRFEVDLNRAPSGAVYRRPEDAWGLDLWHDEPAADLVERSLDIHRSYYAALGDQCDEVIAAHGRVIVLDLHSYNHRRAGPEGPDDDPMLNPEINLGSKGIPDRGWEDVVDAFARTMATQPFGDRTLDVRFDVKFTGGNQVAWLHERYGDRCCAIAVEVKKIYMDEWTGVLDESVADAIGGSLEAAGAAARSALARIDPT